MLVGMFRQNKHTHIQFRAYSLYRISIIILDRSPPPSFYIFIYNTQHSTYNDRYIYMSYTHTQLEKERYMCYAVCVAHAAAAAQTV
jgi:hypothetical protein